MRAPEVNEMIEIITKQNGKSMFDCSGGTKVDGKEVDDLHVLR